MEVIRDNNEIRDKVIVERIYQGNTEGRQYVSFKASLFEEAKKLSIGYLMEIEFVKTKTIRENQSLNLEEILEWLLNSKIHFIITHVHQ